MKHLPVVAAAFLTLTITANAAGDSKLLGEIDFFGHKGLDITAIRSALPFHEGDSFPPAKAKSPDALKQQVSEKIKQTIGRVPTDVSFVCCDSKQNWIVYIGLPGESYRPLAFNPAPAGHIRLPKTALTLRKKMDKTWMNAVMKGNATEDDSEGFTLTNDPKARKTQLAMREYALRNEALIHEVLVSSSDASHRAIAAEMLGYGRQSNEQVDALVRAGLDEDDGVRNDAVRALGILAGARPNLAKRVPADTFIRLLRSGAWADHNKASMLLLSLTRDRDPEVLTLLRAEALDSLIEMAKWRNIGHASAALTILGRIAGIDESSLDKLIEAGQADTIVNQLDRR